MAFTPNDFPAAMEEIRRLSSENTQLQEENSRLTESLKKAQPKTNSGKRTVKQKTSMKGKRDEQ